MKTSLFLAIVCLVFSCTQGKKTGSEVSSEYASGQDSAVYAELLSGYEKFIAKDLRGEALIQTLEELMN